MKKVLVLAGSFDQIELIKKLKERHYTVILVDYFEKPVAKDFADYHYQESTLDINKVYEIAKKEQVEFIITACTDQALLTMAKVSEMLNLPCYLTVNKALALTNKCKMKDIFSEYNIKTSKYKQLTNLHEIEMNIPFPLVIKPANCNSSKGVFKINNKHDLKNMFDIVKSYSRTNEVIIEEFIEGTEISIDVFIQNDKPEILLITETLKMDVEDKFIIKGSLYPCSAVTSEIYIKIEHEISKIAKAFNLSNSPFLVQAIIKDEEVYIIECSARMGGGSKYRIVHQLSGVDIMEEYVNLVLESDFQINKTEKNVHAIVEYKYCKPGVVKEIIGLDELLNKKIISDVFLYKTKHAEITKAETSSDRLFGYFVTADGLSDLEYKQKIIKKSLKAVDVNGNNILIN